MFQIGEKVRLNESGREVMTIVWGNEPKSLRFFMGIHTVRESDEHGVVGLHYPVGLDIEYSEAISKDRLFFIPSNHLERVSDV